MLYIKHIISLFFALIFTTSAVAQSVTFHKPPTQSEQKNITILSHNVFWFQVFPFATDQPPAANEKAIEALTEIYKKESPEILCLQEIQSEETAKLVGKHMGMKYIYQAGGILPQYGCMVLSKWPMEQIQLVEKGFQVDRTLLGVQITLPTGGLLRLANIHLPSSRQRGVQGGVDRRALEINKIVGKADIILGDFNERPMGNITNVLQENGYLDAADACGANHLATTLGHSRIDYVWLSSKIKDRLSSFIYIPNSSLVITKKMSEIFPKKQFLSDHLPVGVRLSIDN